MSVIKAAVIGYGVWGRNHVLVYRELPDVELVTVVDANPGTAKEISQKDNVSWDTSANKVIADPEI